MNILEEPHSLTAPALRAPDPRDLNLRRQNVQAIEAIQSIIMKEDNIVMSRDEVLARILDCYDRYLQFKTYVQQGEHQAMGRRRLFLASFFISSLLENDLITCYP